jgi:membrane-associated phospholipid phosphatase
MPLAAESPRPTPMRAAIALLVVAAVPCLFLQAWTPPAIAASLAIGLLAVIRLTRRAQAGVPPLIALAAFAGVTAFWAAWTFGNATLFALAERMRAALPFVPEQAMRALPGNDPWWAPRLLGDPSLRPAWSAIYLGGWLTVPLLALPWCATQGRAEAVLRIGWSHLACCALALPIFLLLPIPDPWWDAGWLGGLRSPPWWSGIADHVVTCCFPSMHVAVATVVALAAGRGAPRAERIAWWGWVVLLAVSTLAVRTHWMIDLPIGAAFGWLADRILGRVIGWCRAAYAAAPSAEPVATR